MEENLIYSLIFLKNSPRSATIYLWEWANSWDLFASKRNSTVPCIVAVTLRNVQKRKKRADNFNVGEQDKFT